MRRGAKNKSRCKHELSHFFVIRAVMQGWGVAHCWKTCHLSQGPEFDKTVAVTQ